MKCLFALWGKPVKTAVVLAGINKQTSPVPMTLRGLEKVAQDFGTRAAQNIWACPSANNKSIERLPRH